MTRRADPRRFVFLSAPLLAGQYRTVPPEVLDDAVFLFGAKRSWLFPATGEELLEAGCVPADYLGFDEEFKTVVLRQEARHQVAWLLPDRSYQAFSTLLEALPDPATRQPYRPLLLDPEWWRSEFEWMDARYCQDASRIVDNFVQGEFDFEAVMELLHQSNPTLLPALCWP